MPRTNVDATARLIRRFNDWIRGELKRKNKKQIDLAEYLNVSQAIISLRLRGLSEWPFRDVLNACDYFGVKLEEIL